MTQSESMAVADASETIAHDALTTFRSEPWLVALLLVVFWVVVQSGRLERLIVAWRTRETPNERRSLIAALGRQQEALNKLESRVRECERRAEKLEQTARVLYAALRRPPSGGGGGAPWTIHD